MTEQKEKRLMTKLLVKGRNFEISTEGSASEITAELDSLAKLANAVSAKLGFVETAAPATPPSGISREPAPSAAEIPVLKPSKSSTENIQSLFNTTWGKTPRAAEEVEKALEVNAVPDSSSNVRVYLMRLVKRGILRRIEKDGRWWYYKVPASE